MSRVVLAAAVLCATAAVSLAGQTTSSSTQTKTFEVLAVDGNQLIVKLPEGTRELTVPNDFRFTVNGQQMSVQELKAGMKGSATITTQTTVTPVSVTEVKNGTVVQSTGSSIIVRTAEGFKSFTQGDIDKRGVKIMREGRPATVSDFRQGDVLSATIITSKPPQVMTERQVNATLATATAGARAGAGAGAAGGGAPPAAAASRAPSSSASQGQAPQATGSSAAAAPRTLPKTASSWPLLALASVLLLVVGLALAIRRQFVV
jgi:hypothetical protein